MALWILCKKAKIFLSYGNNNDPFDDYEKKSL